MTTPFNERLSAFVDDELSEFEARRMAKELAESKELREKWTRYQLIGSVLRDEDLSSVDPAFAEAIAAAIAVEPSTVKGNERPRVAQRDITGWLKPVVGVAIAASVAAAAVLIGGRVMAPVDRVAPSVASAIEENISGEQNAANRIAETGTVSSDLGTRPITTGVVTPVSSSLGLPGAETSPMNDASVDSLLNDPLFSSFLATHAEYAAHNGILPRVRVVGFDLPDQ